MNHEPSNETAGSDEGRELLARRLFLQSMGKWSGAAITAAVFGGAWLACPPEAKAGAWGNRRGRGGGGGANGRGGGGGGGERGRGGGGGGGEKGGGGGMGQPPWLWRRRCMGQSLIGDFTGTHFEW